MTPGVVEPDRNVHKTVTSPERSAEKDSGLGSAYAWYVVVILSIANILSFVDRQIINLLVEPIRRDFGISDTQISLLQGFAFAVLYSFAAIPLGRLADRRNRTASIAIAMVAWSLATAACGLARNFVQLFIARVGVGIGEAALTPAAFSIIGDYFPRGTVTRAVSMFTASSFLGSGIALLVGGFVIGRVEAVGPVVVPVLGNIYPWQMAFMVVSLPGLLFALIMATVREPKRRMDKLVASERAATGHDQVSIRQMLQHIVAERSSLGAIILGFSILGMVQFGLGAWIPTFFIRTYGWTASEIGYLYGLIFVTFGWLGVMVGGWVSDYLLSRGYTDSNLLVGLAAALLLAPFVAIFPITGNPEVASVLLALITFLGTLPFGAGPATLAIIVPNRMRAQIVAIYMLSVNVIGQGLGPWVIAVFTDYVMKDPMLVGFSLAIVPPACLLTGALILQLARKPLRIAMSRLANEPSA